MSKNIIEVGDIFKSGGERFKITTINEDKNRGKGCFLKDGRSQNWSEEAMLGWWKLIKKNNKTICECTE
jgi:hypothetical protein